MNFFQLLCFKRGGHWGYPLTQYRKKNWQIAKYRVKNRRNTDTVFMIGHVYLKLYPSRVCLPKACMHHKSTSDIARKREKMLIGKTIEKPGHWMPFQFCHRLCKHLP